MFSPRASRSLSLKVVDFLLLAALTFETFCKSKYIQCGLTDGACSRVTITGKYSPVFAVLAMYLS